MSAWKLSYLSSKSVLMSNHFPSNGVTGGNLHWDDEQPFFKGWINVLQPFSVPFMAPNAESDIPITAHLKKCLQIIF